MRKLHVGRVGVVSIVLLAAVGTGWLGWGAYAEAKRDAVGRRAGAEAQMQKGNFKDAYDVFRELLLDPASDEARGTADDLEHAVGCLARLGRVEEADDLREQAVAAHKGNWRLLTAAARSYQRGTDNWGFIVAGKFYRGGHRGNDGRQVSSVERDRTRAMQLFEQALSLAETQAASKQELAEFYFQFAELLLDNRYVDGAWRLQSLTDLKAPLPEYGDMAEVYYGRWAGGTGNNRGAPVGEDGSTPVYHHLPKSWDTAQTDGERWRWCLQQAEIADALQASRARFAFAQFLQGQFHVSTMLDPWGRYGYGSRYSRFALGMGGREDADDKKNDDVTGPFAVSTLKENETIARLATGIKRFTMPDEFNFIRIYKDLAEGKDYFAQQSSDTLGSLFEDRQQYPRAAEWWQTGIKKFGDNGRSRKQRLDQIVGNWGMFESTPTSPAGTSPKLPFVFRNATKASFTAREIDIPKFLADIKAYLKSSPNQLDWQHMLPDNAGPRIVQQGEGRFLGKQKAAWELALRPRERHFDQRIFVEAPLKTAGAYLVEASLNDGGNTTRTIAWVADTVIVKKQIDGGTYYFVADAVSGKPVPNAKLAFFGWRQRQVKDREFHVDTTEFTKTADEQGQMRLTPEQESAQYQYLITATADGGRSAFYGFTSIWGNAITRADFTTLNKTFVITDRPVYRTEQSVKFKCWVAPVSYVENDAENNSLAGRSYKVIITNPKGEKVLERQFESDKFGGFDGELKLDKDATLGAYSLTVENFGGGSFRVEEYKKPEFEVTVDAPSEPVMLGEKITATVRAKYYFGAPVTSAKVKYTVFRSPKTDQWYPAAPWDWFYGPGYWWFEQEYRWYPGWRMWGCVGPRWWWLGSPQVQPEVVSQNEVPIGADGTVKIEIDTASAKALHGDEDHRYTITAEVTDESRRTITGTGTVSAARQAFKVYTWVDQGYYHEGQPVRIECSAQTVDNKPVKGAGELRLIAISYDTKLKPVERVVETWPLATNDEGRASQQIKASRPGQYRLSYTVTDEKKHAIEGAYVFVVRGDGFDGRSFRFNDIELVPDKREYGAGDKVRLMINTARADSTVLLFVRPVNGVAPPPKILRLNGKSTMEEIEVTKKDMPNFFVEAVTVGDGKVFSQTREVFVPPDKKVVNVEVVPSSTKYKPGERAKVTIKLTDDAGKPVTGSAVVSLYDKSVEYISGGSNVPEIREFFWKWRRTHYPNVESSLGRFGYQLLKPGETGLNYLGCFGGLVPMLPLGEADLAVSVVDELEDGAIDAMSGPVSGSGFMLGSRLGVAGGAGGADRFAMAKTSAMPAPAAAPMPAGLMADKAEAKDARANKPGEQPGESGPPLALVEPTLRQTFADTALWVAKLDVGESGTADVELTMPENLTTWKTKVWTMSAGTRVGQASAEVVTAKDLLVRLQAPRFFVQRDEVVLSVNVHNYLKSAKSAHVNIEMEGPSLSPGKIEGHQIGGLINAPDHSGTTIGEVVEVPAGGERRVDFRVRVVQPGTAIVRAVARTDEESDAMQMTFPVLVHGMLKTDSFSGAIRHDGTSARLTYKIPAERIPEQSRIEIRYSPSVASAMVDALPYLVDYPYGCTEQTLNRFVPTVVTQHVLLGMGLNLKDIKDKRTNLNAQEIGDDAKRAADWKRNNPPNPDVDRRNPVFDEAEVAAMVKAGVDKLANQQLADGGWGWFSGYGEQSYAHTTATVVHGLQVARANDVKLPAGMIERGVAWLKGYEAQQVQLLNNDIAKVSPHKEQADNLDAFVYMVLAEEKQQASKEMREFLYRDRNKISAYCMAQFALALQSQKDQDDKLQMLLKNLAQFVVQDDENQTAYLKLPESSGYWWYWYGSDTEANAYYLKLLAKTDPKGQVASRLAKNMINNRKHASYWNSTRDTALSIEALADYIRASGEDKPDMTVAISIDGQKMQETPINAANLFSFNNKLVLSGADIKPGEHKIEFTKTGSGPLYFNAYVTNFTLEEPITRAGLEIKVQRKYYRLDPVDKKVKVSGSRGQAIDQKVQAYDRKPLGDGDTLTSGTLVEAELEIDSKNDYEYILFEDMKAPGFEPVDVQSGYNGNDLGAYMELRDERVCFFTRALARGKHSVSYRVRAEIPGVFHALPTRASAMYAPELKANSDETHVTIVDSESSK